MWTASRLKSVFQDTQIDYESLWDTLSFFKGNVTDEKTAALFDFQYRLGWRLRTLQLEYNSIKSEERQLTVRKNEVKKAWFAKRMGVLLKYREAIKLLMSIGRNLGDIFAYFFYRNNLDELNSQMQHEEISSFPEGDGGLGELAFIRHNKHFEGHFTVYHGITNILRKGDVSFVSTKTMTLSGVGEIKTLRTSGRLEIQVMIIGRSKLNSLGKALFSVPEKPPKLYSYDAFSTERAKKQIKQIRQIFTSLKENKSGADYNDSFHLEPLGQLLKEAKPNQYIYAQMSRGLGYVVVRNKSHRMFDIFVKKLKVIDPKNSLTNVKNLLIPGDANNQIIYGSFLLNQAGKSQISLGYAPLFFSSLPSELLQQMYLGQVAVVTVFNPAHLFNDLINLGFVQHKKDDGYELELVRGDRRITLPAWTLKLLMDKIINHGHSEDGILHTITEVVAFADSSQIDRPVRINIDIKQLFYKRKAVI